MECAGKTSDSKVPKITKTFKGHEQCVGWCTNSINLSILSRFTLTISSMLYITSKETHGFLGPLLPSLMIDNSATCFIIWFSYPCKRLPGLASYCTSFKQKVVLPVLQQAVGTLSGHCQMPGGTCKTKRTELVLPHNSSPTPGRPCH